jgi:N-acetylmuramoyl-L-alanine amidase
VKRLFFTLATFLTTCVAVRAQGPMVLLDPARGGSESGAHIADRVEEKQVTLAMAQRMASLLRARGFTVELTRDADADTTNDARAALANTTHPIACVLLHATAVGNGVHLYTTSLAQTANAGDPNAPATWDAAQAAYADRSRALASELQTAFSRSKMPVSSGTTWMRPLDNMQCPAVAVEVSPEKDGTGADDTHYQTQVTDVVANAMLFWRGKVASLTPAPPPPPPPKVEPASPAPARNDAP